VSAFLRAWVGLPCPPGSRMSGRERIDFSIIAALFAVLVAASGAFGSLTNQIFVSFESGFYLDVFVLALIPFFPRLLLDAHGADHMIYRARLAMMIHPRACSVRHCFFQVSLGHLSPLHCLIVSSPITFRSSSKSSLLSLGSSGFRSYGRVRAISSSHQYHC
jgi:hypothetical protein